MLRQLAVIGTLTLAAAVPAPAASHERRKLDESGGSGWAIEPSFSATLALGVAFDTPNTGIIVGGDDGLGAAVYTTSDGGRSFGRAQLPAGGPTPPLILLDGDVLREDSVVSGIFVGYHSSDSYRSYQVAEGSIGPAQSVDSFIRDGQSTFVITGDTLGYNGIAVSSDGGASFGEGVNVYGDDAPGNPLARYGAFVGDTWFVSGGRWPSTSSFELSPKMREGEQVRSITESIRVRGYANSSKRSELAVEFSDNVLQQGKTPADKREGYVGAIAKSTDGGASWNTVFSDTTAYFNQIACFTAERCIVVGEGASDAQILVTDDGGQSWRPTLQAEGSLVAVQVLNQDGEAWAAGGVFGFPQFTAHFYHTLDFGTTWTRSDLDGGIVWDISFPPAQGALGFATILRQTGTSGFARYEQPQQE